MKRVVIGSIIIIIILAVIVGCSPATPAPTPTPMPTNTPIPIPTLTPTPNAASFAVQYLEDISTKSNKCVQSTSLFGSLLTSVGESPNLLLNSSFLDSVYKSIDQVETACTQFSVLKPPVMLEELNNIFTKLDNEYVMVVTLSRSAFQSMDGNLLKQATKHIDLAGQYANKATEYMNNFGK